jgi:gluconate 5-dehydrogenase
MATLASLQNLKNKNILVLGGSGYLGTAACEVFAELGANIIVASRSKKNCEEVINRISKGENQFHSSIDCDISKKESIQNLSKFIKDKYKKINVLVICAWNGKKNSWESIDQKDWESDIDICLNSNFKVIKIMQETLTSPSKIILVSSMYGIVAPNPSLYENVPQENPPSYGVAKAGIIQFTKYLAAWLAKDKITVNCISPGPFPFPSVKKDYPDFCDRLKKKNPMAKLGIPDDLKGVFALLSTKSSDFITGQNISVDGGWTIW